MCIYVNQSINQTNNQYILILFSSGLLQILKTDISLANRIVYGRLQTLQNLS